MMLVFRASGSDFDPRQFAADHQLDPISFWAKGEQRRRGAASETSGFRLSLPNADTSQEVQQIVRSLLKEGRRWIEALKAEGLDCEVDVGLTVGSDAIFVASVTFDPSFLNELASSGVGLVCSAYPWSD